MKKIALRIVALLLVVLLAADSGMFLKAEAISSSKKKKENTSTTEEVKDEPWLNNILVEDPLGVFGIEKEKIYSVTFLDNLDDAPRKAWNMAKGASTRVKGWMEWNGAMVDVYFAAKDGINGEECAEALFAECINLEVICFNGALHTDLAESMDQMFLNCASLEEVDIETLDTSSAESMSEMFRGCEALEELDVSNFNTENVTSMYCMFSTCMSLEELDLSSFDTAKVTNMGFMFSACKALEEVEVSGFDTSKVYNMEGMFRWCDSLEYLDITGWNLKRVKSYSNFMNPGIYYDGKPWENIFK